jgi:hypothetical protein
VSSGLLYAGPDEDETSKFPRTRVWSWDFKIYRAEKHLEEVRKYIADYSKTRPYRSERDLETDASLNTYTVRATLEAPADYILATILGEFFYNLRSALDHMAVALAPPNRRRRASFPIALRDPWELDPKTGQPSEADEFVNARRTFKSSIHGMSASAKAKIKSFQPYMEGPNATRTALAILDELAQADKHRELLVVARYLHNPHTMLRFVESGAEFRQWRAGAFEDGEIVASFPFSEPVEESDVQVHIHGGVDVGVKLADAPQDDPLPDILENLLGVVSGVVAPALEAELRA